MTPWLSPQRWSSLGPYELFEQFISVALLTLVGLAIVYSLIIAGAQVLSLIRSKGVGLEIEVIQDTFGSLMTVLILLEFNHSIFVGMQTRSSALQVRFVVLIAILVIARKLILLDYHAADYLMLFGMGAISLSLGGLYWLLADGDRRHAPSAPAHVPPRSSALAPPATAPLEPGATPGE